MNRVVIEIHPDVDGDGFQVVLSEPDTIDNSWVAVRFPYKPTDAIPSGFADGRSTVKEIGAYLVNGLRAHPAVRTALKRLLESVPRDGVSPLYIRLTPDAEGLPWETLFDKSARFLALDPRWPVARMGRAGGRRTPTIDFEPPLRVMAVLAAANVDATAEWTGLYAALQGAGFPVSLRVLVAQRDLYELIGQASDPNVAVSVAYVPGGRAILDEFGSFRPNLLHFFSHGHVLHGFPEIDVATLSTWPNPAAGGSVILDPQSLAMQPLLDSVWVLTLNICRGAQAGGAGSLAYSLLSSGFPVVAGMREPVSESDAHAFCRRFYRSLMALLSQIVPSGPEVELDLAAALYEPRMEICDEHRGASSCLDAASSSSEWSLPVLYVRHGGLAIRRREPAAQPVLESPAPTTADETRPGVITEDNPEPAGGAPAALEEDVTRTIVESKLKVLKDLVAAPLPGTDPRALDAFNEEIARLERELYTNAADTLS
jgi:hypothetical protein